MALDYTKIRRDKEQEYGTKVGNYGRLLANLYSDRAHFIFELLQNCGGRSERAGGRMGRTKSSLIQSDEESPTVQSLWPPIR